MIIDPLTMDRDDYRSRDEEYRDWCEEHGLDPADDDSRHLYLDAPWDPINGKGAPDV